MTKVKLITFCICVVMISVSAISCSKSPDCKQRLQGTWTNSDAGFSFDSAYDFVNGKTSSKAMGQAEEKSLEMKSCNNEMAVFKSGESEITAVFKDDKHVMLKKSGGFSFNMMKTSDVYRTFD